MRSSSGISLVIVCAIVMSIVLLIVSASIHLSKKKNVEVAIAQEYNMRTYYVAMAGINECISTRMLPRTNSIIARDDLSKTDMLKYSKNRINNSGKIYSNPYSSKKEDLIGSYTYVSYVIGKDSDGNDVISNFLENTKSEKYLVYSKGVTVLPDGQEDSLTLKAVFDLNRIDNDVINADELESLEVLSKEMPEHSQAISLINKVALDRIPPIPREVTFTSLGGGDITLGIHGKNDKLELDDVGVRSKINIKFTEPIDSRFLDDVNIVDVKTNDSLDKLEKIVLSPKNVDLVILPPKQNKGKSFDYGKEYRLEIKGIVDFLGNKHEDGPEIIFKIEEPVKSTIEPDIDSESEANSDSLNEFNPFEEQSFTESK